MKIPGITAPLSGCRDDIIDTGLGARPFDRPRRVPYAVEAGAGRTAPRPGLAAEAEEEDCPYEGESERRLHDGVAVPLFGPLSARPLLLINMDVAVRRS